MFSYGPFSHTGLKLDISSEVALASWLPILNPRTLLNSTQAVIFLRCTAGYGGFYLNVCLEMVTLK
ncbi:hypothetical protein D5R40_32145 [Okeania hirsuta]|uniref:Uncharacterized protein n=1 Tax=Okeania hirsuta TaxID=1458930 RepID=A0A3N6P946_9CYAN|nr:hypothetical protein D5R40_32145 [Okeania hirsuta]